MASHVENVGAGRFLTARLFGVLDQFLEGLLAVPSGRRLNPVWLRLPIEGRVSSSRIANSG